jgi:aspartyl/asparaginyl beta-hydroxylase (cupin superfamily)
LPLIVPPNCRFRVGESTVEWHEGKMLAFDDTVEHEARNDSDQDRLILLFYIWNPLLSDEERLLVRTMLEVVHDYR